MPIEPFRSLITCPNCQERFSAETASLRWIRNHPHLNYLTRTDADQVFVKWNADQSIKYEFDLEIKEYGARQNANDQILWQERDEMLRGVHHLSSGVIKIHLGCHVLRLEKSDPSTSKWIEFNSQVIDERTLVEILAFNRHPDHPHHWLNNLACIEIRRRFDRWGNEIINDDWAA
jgi:hypothetical protein